MILRRIWVKAEKCNKCYKTCIIYLIVLNFFNLYKTVFNKVVR